MAITLLTGAGASRAFEYPTTIEFFSELAPNENKQHQEILQRLRQQIGTTQLDVEDVLSILEPIEDFFKTPSGKFTSSKLADNWQQKIITFSKLCRDRCFELYGKDPKYEIVSEYYLPILNSCGWKDNKVSLYTTNYDPISDSIMDLAEEHRLPCYDGFKSRGKWDPENYNEHVTGLNIYRLHGSMSWVQRNGHIINTRDYTLRQGKVDHLLIYPGYKGNPENERQEAYSFPHISLRKELYETEYFIVIGFAFRDKHINSIVSDALKNNEKLKIIVVNPEWPEGENGFLSNIRDMSRTRIIHLEFKFGNKKLEKSLANVLSTT